MGIGAAPAPGPAVEQPDALLAKLKYAVYAAANPAEPALGDVLTYYERIRAYVAHEDDLTNARLTWSLTTQGFLFATFGFVLGKMLDFATQPLKPGAPPLGRLFGYLVAFEVVVACVGVLIGLCSLWAVRASHNSIQALQKIAHFHGPLAIRGKPGEITAQALLIPNVIGGGAGPLPTLGGNYQLLLPLLTALAWGAILAILWFLWFDRLWVFGAAAMG